jgi:hypothetical protein
MAEQGILNKKGRKSWDGSSVKWILQGFVAQELGAGTPAPAEGDISPSSEI